MAEITKRQCEEAGTTAIAVEKPEPEAAAEPTTLQDAQAEFETGYITAKQLKDATARKYRTILKQLRAFATEKGYRFVKEFGVAELQGFQASWKLGPRAASKRLEHVRTFFQFCLDREFITNNPGDEAPLADPNCHAEGTVLRRGDGPNSRCRTAIPRAPRRLRRPPCLFAHTPASVFRAADL